MPELPEVEIARRQLARWLGGRRIDAVHVEDPAVVRSKASTLPRDAHPDGMAQAQALVGQTLDQTARHGKRLGLRAGPSAFLVHLGMTGRWRWRTDGTVPRFSKLGLAAGDGVAWFTDMRRFGCVVPVAPDALASALCAGHGPDALDAPPDGEALAERFDTRKAIKVALLDQHRLAGLGNIQAAEALFRARIHPSTPATALDPDAWKRLAQAIPVQLRYTLGATDAEEVEYMTDGKHVANPFAVYGRDEQPCPACGTAVARGRHGGRSTFWCPRCQPAA